MIHIWFLEDAWNHGKLPEHAKKLEISTSALMRGFSSNLCRIECICDNLNSTNNPQKSEFQDKGREDTDKVEENISENSASNKTAVDIRIRNIPIKRGRHANMRRIFLRGGKNSEKRGEKE